MAHLSLWVLNRQLRAYRRKGKLLLDLDSTLQAKISQTPKLQTTLLEVDKDMILQTREMLRLSLVQEDTTLTTNTLNLMVRIGVLEQKNSVQELPLRALDLANIILLLMPKWNHLLNIVLEQHLEVILQLRRAVGDRGQVQEIIPQAML